MGLVVFFEFFPGQAERSRHVAGRRFVKNLWTSVEDDSLVLLHASAEAGVRSIGCGSLDLGGRMDSAICRTSDCSRWAFEA